ncbi:MAG: hypothetical protein JW885_03950 [Deltaproteobacteria bacterium]|nr:hypothetical protein [Candidatus Zymogenaceae bacterium]
MKRRVVLLCALGCVVVCSIFPSVPAGGFEDTIVLEDTGDAEIIETTVFKGHIIDFLVSNFRTIAAFVAIFSFLFAVYNHFMSKKDKERDRKYFKEHFDWIEKEIQKDLSQDEIASLEGRLEELKEQIEQAPRLAKMVVLKDKYNSLIDVLNENYESLRLVEKQITEAGGTAELDENLQEAVSSIITPQYVIKKRLSNLKNILILTTATAAIAASILPTILEIIISLPFLVLSGYIVFQMSRLYFRENLAARFDEEEMHRIRRMVVIFLLFFAAFFTGVIIVTVILERMLHGMWDIGGVVDIVLVACAAVMFLISFGLLRRFGTLRKTIDNSFLKELMEI